MGGHNRAAWQLEEASGAEPDVEAGPFRISLALTVKTG